ncbi:MAG: hypothetical protein IKF91_02435 [Bacilli bacterium]|nr:hypothetical protein [Bacilli bacterium]
MFFILPYKVNAVTYQETNQSTFQYNINNFKLDGDYIIINGWGTTDRHQDLTGDDTHEFSLVLTDKSNNESKVYIATLKYADKTRLMRASEAVNHCSGYFNNGNCHYKYTYAGFEFKIPLSDLNADTEYDIKLRIYEKKVNRGYQESIYVLGIDDSYEKNGMRYQLYSDISKTNVTLTDSSLFVRSGPGQNYSIKSSNKSCSGNGKTLFWYPNGYFSHIIGASQTKPGSVDSELWVNMQYDLGGCVYGKARAVNGTSNNGWAPWVYMLGGGDPAVIKVTSLTTISIDELRAYTAEANTKTKALLTLTSTKNQNITIKAYHNNNLVYNKVHNISGTKSFKIDYTIPNKGTLKVEVIDEHFTQSISSNIYVSSKKEYKLDLSNKSGVILVDNPILVVTDKNRNVTEYKEKIQLSAIPYEIDLSQGRGISGVTSAISYWYPLEEFSLNSDYSVYALYPSQENTMNYEIVDGKVKVNLLKDDVVRSSDHDISYFYHPNILLSLIQGHLYTDADNEYTYYNGGGIWYPAWNDELGTYDYEYVGTNLGINKITIKRDLVYSITTTMFGVETGKFTIKRVKNPDNPNVIYKRTFTYDELKEYAGD